MNLFFEALCIEIPALNVVVSSLYRKPNYSYCAVFLRRLEILFNSLPKEIKSQSIYYAADFNLNIAEDCFPLHFHDDFLNVIRCYGFVENFRSHTRITKTAQTLY